MLDPIIQLGASRMLLSSIRFDAASRKKHLAHLHQTGQPPLCLCTSEPVHMGVARRTTTAGPIYYLYHLHRADPQLHHERCPHRIEESDHSPQAHPQTTQTPQTPSDNAPTQPILEHRIPIHPAETPEPAGPKLTLSTLLPRRPEDPPVDGLEAVLESVLLAAGLNVWHPGFARHRGYQQVRSRVLASCERLHVNGAPLAPLVFFPPFWEPEHQDRIDAQWAAFLKKLTPDSDRIPRGLFMGRLREIEHRPNWSAPRIKFSETRHSLWLDGFERLIEEAPNPLSTWFVMAAVECQDGSKLRVIDAAAMRVTPNWVPVYSAQQAQYAAKLTASQTAFVAPLRIDSPPSLLLQVQP